MKKNFIIIVLLGFTLNIQAQDLALHFSGRFADSTATRLDSVTVENLTKKWKETIVYPDTVWEYRSDGIKKTADNGMKLQAFPNPAFGEGIVELQLSKASPVRIQLLNTMGQTLAETAPYLTEGRHCFSVSMRAKQCYFIRVATPHHSMAVKLINSQSGNNNAIVWMGHLPEAVTAHLSVKPFEPGDTLRYTGYTTWNDSVIASHLMQKAQQTGEKITLWFEKPLPFSEKMIVGTWEACGYTSESMSIPNCFDAWYPEDGLRDTLVFLPNDTLLHNWRKDNQFTYKQLNDSTLQLTNNTLQYTNELRICFLNDGHEMVIFCFRQYGMATVLSSTRFRKID